MFRIHNSVDPLQIPVGLTLQLTHIIVGSEFGLTAKTFCALETLRDWKPEIYRYGGFDNHIRRGYSESRIHRKAGNRARIVLKSENDCQSRADIDRSSADAGGAMVSAPIVAK
jgi:hypothetical protein